MNFWLFDLIARILTGEPLEKSTTADAQLWGSAFASIPVFLVLALLTLKRIDNSPAWVVIAGLTTLASLYIFLWLGALRRLPLWGILLLALVAWPIFAAVTWTR